MLEDNVQYSVYRRIESEGNIRVFYLVKGHGWYAAPMWVAVGEKLDAMPSPEDSLFSKTDIDAIFVMISGGVWDMASWPDVVHNHQTSEDLNFSVLYEMWCQETPRAAAPAPL